MFQRKDMGFYVRRTVYKRSGRPDFGYSQFKIDWAVDHNGVFVTLDEIDFVRIYTAVNQDVGWMGEISTEIMTVEDLHFED